MRWKILLGLVLAALVTIVAAQNAGPLTVRFLFWSFQMSQALVIFFSGMAGFFVGWLLAATRALKKPAK
jgi:uncharacterized integral membrane protein